MPLSGRINIGLASYGDLDSFSLGRYAVVIKANESLVRELGSPEHTQKLDAATCGSCAPALRVGPARASLHGDTLG